ncbi:MAG: PAS domain S-box protein [Gemmatimonadetes bacterium]|nr:PAS domain S-box protein [Gemmatimonadota bacterium]MYG22555.1 PAS domain S-box protein [Gemmatimonadota bacterium]MYJ38912.1 PAS domain S-box protein [Gemmatimonadota bacterium]
MPELPLGSRAMSIRSSDRMEQPLLSDRDYRAVFEASPDAMLIVDPDGLIRDLNPQALTMFGWRREEMEGSGVEMLVPAARRTRHERHRLGYAEAPRPRPMGQGLELQALRKDGTTFPVEISLSPGELASGPEHVICTVRDISAWKRMRWLSRMKVMAAENERRHLSRELHDEFLQFLVAFKIRGKLLAEETDREERARAWAVISDEILDAIRGVKRMIRGLRASKLEQQGLVSALASFFRDIRKVHGVTIHASLRLKWVADELDPITVLALYRIVQEAVTNAATHANVSEAAVTLRSTEGVIIAEIRDEGCGFELPDPGIAPDDGHIGLVGMRERAEAVGGSLTVETSPGRGTTVRAAVPMIAPDGEPW